jgi:hypothetical protein
VERFGCSLEKICKAAECSSFLLFDSQISVCFIEEEKEHHCDKDMQRLYQTAEMRARTDAGFYL